MWIVLMLKTAECKERNELEIDPLGNQRESKIGKEEVTRGHLRR